MPAPSTPRRPSAFVDSGGIELAVYRHGPKDAPPLLLVHGYPDSSHIWDGSVERLRERFHVITYDVRGAGASGVPRRVRDYALAQLVEDMAAVIDASSPQRPVHLVAHDWGSIQGWEAVCSPRLAGRIASYTTLSGPSLDHAGHWLRRRLRQRAPGQLRDVGRQLLASWYIAFFQLPLIPPALWRLGLARAWPTLLRRAGVTQPPHNPRQCKDGMHGIKLYRANMIPRLLRPGQRRTDLPVQVLVLRDDPHVLPALMDDVGIWAPRSWRRELDAGHWAPLTHAAVIAEAVTGFVDFVDGRAPLPAELRAIEPPAAT